MWVCQGEGFVIEEMSASGEAEDTGEDSAPILMHSSFPCCLYNMTEVVCVSSQSGQLQRGSS